MSTDPPVDSPETPEERAERWIRALRWGTPEQLAARGIEPPFNAARRLTPIVVLVTDDTLHALNDYVTTTESIIRNDAPDVEHALDRIGANGWTPTMLIAGQLLAAALADGD